MPIKIRNIFFLTRTELYTGLVILVVTLAAVAGSRLSRLYNTRSVYSEQSVELYFNDKFDLKRLAQVLSDSGVVDDRGEMMWAGRLLGWRSFHPGHYEIEGGYSYDVFLSKLARGIQDPVRVTIVPGSTPARIAVSISSKMQFDSATIAAKMKDSTLLSSFGLTGNQLIGRFLPNTYSFYWTSSPETVVKRVLAEFENKVLVPYEARFEELDKTVDEILSLASIIEWEANIEDEKKRISGLYWNRLDRGMRLQADPTINYAVGERRRLLYEDYQIDHPYNTYLHPGLPPGPITNPALGSIEAALYPEQHDYLYMVASPEGYHAFSETYEEHQRKSEKWRQWLREQYRLKRQRENGNSR